MERLTDRLVGVSSGWWNGRPDPDGPTRSELARSLVLALAEIGRQAGSGAPSGAAPHAVAQHAIADPSTVLAADILAAPRCDPQVTERAAADVRRCYAGLWVSR